jgi:hypothetical protein
MAEKRKAGLFRYLKEAFLFRWNLLFFGGAAAAAMLSGHGDIALPLVAAGELAYLAGLTSLPRFQAAIDARAHAETRGLVRPAATPEEARERLTDLLLQLDPKSSTRFQNLHSRCHQMRFLAQGASGSTTSSSDADALRIPALDRLLWVFLRLLFAQQALANFLSSTNAQEIESTLKALETRQADAQKRGDERILRSVADSIRTARLRLENYQKAQSNADFVAVEIDRIEGKIKAITEMAVGHQDPDYISNQVDAVAEGMGQTEAAIRELNHITGLTDDMAGTPSILEADLAEVLKT